MRVEGSGRRELILRRRPMPEDLALVELWRVRVGDQVRAYAEHWHALDASERHRASSFRNEADRQRSVIARGTLRVLLGHRLQIEPPDVSFGSNDFGKPVLATHQALHFNTSHSGDWIIHGLSATTPLGVDVQAQLPEPFVPDDFDRVLAAPELERLRSLPASSRRAAFTELWVCKEAYVKALGEGLSRALGEICIAPLEHGGYALLRDQNPGGMAGPWTLCMIDFGTGYAGCLAYPGAQRSVRLLDYSESSAGTGPPRAFP